MSTAAPQPSTQQQQTESAPGVSAARWRRDALRHSKLKPTERLVAVALADFMDVAGGKCRPSHEGIATRTGLHRNAVGRALRGLEASGWVDVERPASPNQHARSTYHPKNPTNVVELLRLADDVVDDLEGACTAEPHAKGACTPGVHKVERPVEPKGETGSLQSPVSTDKPNTSGLEAPEAPRPPEESSPRNVTQDLSDDLGGSTASAVTERLEWLDPLERERIAEPESFAWWRPPEGAAFRGDRDGSWLAWLDELELELEREREPAVPSANARRTK